MPLAVDIQADAPAKESSSQSPARGVTHHLSLEVEPVTAQRWPDLAELFTRPGPRGGAQMAGGCWCMWWRARTGDADLNRAAMYEVVANGRVVGLLAYRDERPVGWVSVGRRADFPLLSASRRYGGGQGSELARGVPEPETRLHGQAGVLPRSRFRDRARSAPPNRRTGRVSCRRQQGVDAPSASDVSAGSFAGRQSRLRSRQTGIRLRHRRLRGPSHDLVDRLAWGLQRSVQPEPQPRGRP